MVSVEQLTVEFGGRPLFDSISFLVNPKDKIALVGKNGAGKTTLLRLFAGQQQPTHGNIIKPKELTLVICRSICWLKINVRYRKKWSWHSAKFG